MINTFMLASWLAALARFLQSNVKAFKVVFSLTAAISFSFSHTHSLSHDLRYEIVGNVRPSRFVSHFIRKLPERGERVTIMLYA